MTKNALFVICVTLLNLSDNNKEKKNFILRKSVALRWYFFVTSKIIMMDFSLLFLQSTNLMKLLLIKEKSNYIYNLFIKYWYQKFCCVFIVFITLLPKIFSTRI